MPNFKFFTVYFLDVHKNPCFFEIFSLINVFIDIKIICYDLNKRLVIKKLVIIIKLEKSIKIFLLRGRSGGSIWTPGHFKVLITQKLFISDN